MVVQPRPQPVNQPATQPNHQSVQPKPQTIILPNPRSLAQPPALFSRPQADINAAALIHVRNEEYKIYDTFGACCNFNINTVVKQFIDGHWLSLGGGGNTDVKEFTDSSKQGEASKRRRHTRLLCYNSTDLTNLKTRIEQHHPALLPDFQHKLKQLATVKYLFLLAGFTQETIEFLGNVSTLANVHRAIPIIVKDENGRDIIAHDNDRQHLSNIAGRLTFNHSGNDIVTGPSARAACISKIPQFLGSLPQLMRTRFYDIITRQPFGMAYRNLMGHDFEAHNLAASLNGLLQETFDGVLCVNDFLPRIKKIIPPHIKDIDLKQFPIDSLPTAYQNILRNFQATLNR